MCPLLEISHELWLGRKSYQSKTRGYSFMSQRRPAFRSSWSNAESHHVLLILRLFLSGRKFNIHLDQNYKKSLGQWVIFTSFSSTPNSGSHLAAYFLANKYKERIFENNYYEHCYLHKHSSTKSTKPRCYPKGLDAQTEHHNVRGRPPSIDSRQSVRDVMVTPSR